MSAGRSERERKRVDARRNEDKTRGKTEGTEASGNGDDSPSLLPFLRFPFLLCSLSLSSSIYPPLSLCIWVFVSLFVNIRAI